MNIWRLQKVFPNSFLRSKLLSPIRIWRWNMRTEVLHQKKEWSSILPTPGIIAKQTSPQNNPLNRKPNPLPFPEDNLVDYQNLKNKTSLKRTNSSPKCANTKTMELHSQVLPNQNPFNNNRSPFNFHNMRNLRTLKMKKMI